MTGHREPTVLLNRERVNKGTERKNSLPLSPLNKTMQLNATYNTYNTRISYTKKKKEMNKIKQKKSIGVAHPPRQRYFALNFLSVLFLKANVRSQRIFSLSKTQKISKLGAGGFI